MQLFELPHNLHLHQKEKSNLNHTVQYAKGFITFWKFMTMQQDINEQILIDMYSNKTAHQVKLEIS